MQTTRPALYAIKLRKTNLWFRAYQNGKQWVTRKHYGTATLFDTEAEAEAAIEKFNLRTHEAKIIIV
jgi:hypothetical protein